jgi:predicted GNAT superfamily acetyltransferase
VTDPWQLAHDKAVAAGVSLRPLRSVEDADLINDVIGVTWGGQHLDRELIRALALSGNVPWGAFDGEELIGFVLGWAGVDEEGLHVHSHMLAATPDRRHKGVGEALKLAQRAQALDQGIEVMRWTFDPMVARNAWLNLGKLGAVIDRFARALYGEMGDVINRGERSDRFTVAWDLRREPGPRTVPVDLTPVALLRSTGDPSHPIPSAAASPPGPVATIEVPADYHELRARDTRLATTWRDAVAEAAERCLGAHLCGVAFDRSRSAYVFTEAVPE